MPDCSGLYGPPGEVAPPNQNRDTPPFRLRSTTFHFRDTPQEPKMLRALKNLRMGRFARYNRFPSRRHLKNFQSKKSSSVSLFWAKKAKKQISKYPFRFPKTQLFLMNFQQELLSIHLRFFFVLNFLKYFVILIFFWKQNLIPP